MATRYAGRSEPVAAAVAALGAKLAKSDGQITTLEILAFRRIFNVAQDDVAQIGGLWRHAGATGRWMARLRASAATR